MPRVDTRASSDGCRIEARDVTQMRMLIYGLPGYGKTTYLHDYIRQNPKHRYFVVDHADEWGPDAGHWRGNPPEIYVIEGPKQVPDEFDFEGVYVFRQFEGTDVAQLCIDVGHSVYVDDEIDLIAGKSGGWDENPIRALVHRGRHVPNAQGEITECHLLGACRRPQSLHTDLSEQADSVRIFRVQGKRTLDRLRADSHIEDEEWDVIRELPPFHYKAWPEGKFFTLTPLGKPDSKVQESEVVKMKEKEKPLLHIVG